MRTYVRRTSPVRAKLLLVAAASAPLVVILDGGQLSGMLANARDARPPDFRRLTETPITENMAPHSLAANQAMIEIPAGTYTLGDDQGPADQRPEHVVALAAFRIDRTEVTNAAFAEYLNALNIELAGDFAAGSVTRSAVAGDAYDLLRESGEGSDLYPIIALNDAQALIGAEGAQFVAKPGYEDHPVTETTWAGSRAYCRWRGGRLPTEAEWEAVARGTDARLYPWGNEPPSDRLVFTSGRTGVTAPVGSRPSGASPFSALDMSGSLAEWTSSLKRPYPYNAADGREDPDASGERVTRGGDHVYDTEPRVLTATHRDGFSNAPNRGHRHIGFRCAADGHSS